MSKRTSERKMGTQIARQVATIERQKRQIEMLKRDNEELENRLAFNQSHLHHHHPDNDQTCGWVRDLMIRMDSLTKEGLGDGH